MQRFNVAKELDKLILLAVALIFGAAAIYLSIHKAADTIVNWAMTLSGGAITSLAVLINPRGNYERQSSNPPATIVQHVVTDSKSVPLADAPGKSSPGV